MDVRIGYLPYSSNLTQPSDRRRFVAYARARKVSFELARPDERYDLVVLSELADTTVWADYPHGKVVYDLIDSFLAVPRTALKEYARAVARFATRRNRRLALDAVRGIRRLCERADAVICTTDEQRADILPSCANVHIILDVQSSVIRRTKADYACGTGLRLVWEGLPSNVAQLERLRPVFSALQQRFDLSLDVVTDLYSPRFLGRFGRVSSLDRARRAFKTAAVHAWTEATCANIVCDSDLAVIPIDLRDPLAAGKPENKLLLFWRMAMPVVTSATPAYARAMRAAGLGFLACTTRDEWIDVIGRLAADVDLRREAGTRGKAYAETQFSEECILARWDEAFDSVGFQFGHQRGVG